MLTTLALALGPCAIKSTSASFPQHLERFRTRDAFAVVVHIVVRHSHRFPTAGDSLKPCAP
jgi:hypothetical protein